ncbi:MAG: TlpA disulfide reductase family protein [bacterium]|nr:TlpA disulfide reductase family protein [bacterium]
MKTKRRVSIMMLSLLLIFVSCKSYEVRPSRPQMGQKVEITVKGNFNSPLVEVIYLKENLDFDFDVLPAKVEAKSISFDIAPDTLTSYVIWRIVDSNLVYFPNGEGLVFYYGKKPMRLACYYKGMHTEKAIPYPVNLTPVEQRKVIKKAEKIYKKGLKYYPSCPVCFSRLKILQYFKLKDEQSRAKYLYKLEKTLDSLFNTGDLMAQVAAFNVAYFFSFPKTYDYFKYLSENPFIPGALDVAMSYLYQYARSLDPKEGAKWLEIGLNKYSDYIKEPSSRIKNILRNYYYSLYYAYLVQGDTVKAIDYLRKLQQIYPMDPSPYVAEASLRMEMGTLNYRIIDSLLVIAEKSFNPIAYSHTYPFYDAKSRDKAVKRNLTDLYRVESRYFLNIGDTGRAVAVLEKAIQVQGGDLYADFGDHEQVGDLLFATGNFEKAVKHYAYAVITGAEEERILKDFQEKLKSTSISRDSITILIFNLKKIIEENKVPAPDFLVETIDGQKLRLKDLKGKVVVLNFWATWCGPCRREIPELNNLVEKYKDNSNVIFVGVTNDLRERVANFLSRNEFRYIITFDVDSVYEKYNVTAVPTHVIIDKNGFITSRIVGSLPHMDEILSQKIEKMLK